MALISQRNCSTNLIFGISQNFTCYQMRPSIGFGSLPELLHCEFSDYCRIVIATYAQRSITLWTFTRHTWERNEQDFFFLKIRHQIQNDSKNIDVVHSFEKLASNRMSSADCNRLRIAFADLRFFGKFFFGIQCHRAQDISATLNIEFVDSCEWRDAVEMIVVWWHCFKINISIEIPRSAEWYLGRKWDNRFGARKIFNLKLKWMDDKDGDGSRKIQSLTV